MKEEKKFDIADTPIINEPLELENAKLRKASEINNMAWDWLMGDLDKYRRENKDLRDLLDLLHVYEFDDNGTQRCIACMVIKEDGDAPKYDMAKRILELYSQQDPMGIYLHYRRFTQDDKDDMLPEK